MDIRLFFVTGNGVSDLSVKDVQTNQLLANVTNLTDEDYISTIGSGGFAKADPTGTAQTILPGAPRQFFLSVKKAF